MKKTLLLGIIIIGLFIITGCGNSNKSSEDANINSNNKTNNAEQENIQENIKEDNQELINLLNTTVDKLLEYSKTNEYKEFRPSAIYQIEDKLKEDEIKNYVFLALCDKEYKEKNELETFTNDASMIPNYDGKCTYSTWSFDNPKYNNGENRYVLVKDHNTKDYYSVKITFKKTTHYDKEKYYPIFSNSKLLK